ncbi:MAG: DUF3108 domain-containing protein [candidate division KSB1 bacterium]|nr:DUF3108 domain-containing protein [candidate division KSB1 bacterium]
MIRSLSVCAIVLALLWMPQVQDTSRKAPPAVDTVRVQANTSEATKHDSLVTTTHMFSSPLAPLRVVPNNAWGLGEELTFAVRYGMVSAGSAKMAVRDTVRVAGRLCYHIYTQAQSNRAFSSIYEVRDVAESFVDVQGLFPWRFEKHLREGKYRAHKLTTYDQHRNLAITGKDTLRVPPFVQDVISMVYFLRTQDFKVGDTLSVANHADRKVYDLRVAVQRRERVRVSAGVFDCLVVEPFLRDGGGVFKGGGRMQLWISDDRARLPVQLKSKVVVGTVTIELERAKGVKRA